MRIKLVVQSRYASTRLPGKALYPLAGMPMLVFLLRRLKGFGYADDLVLATTANPEDDALSAWAKGEGVAVVRGEEQDVLARFLRCAEDGTDYLVRITADNPLTDSRPLADTVAALGTGEYDYVAAFDGYPVGMGVDGFSCAMLREIHAKSDNPRHREHLNAFLLDEEHGYRCLTLSAPPELSRPDLSLTVDTAEEWAFVSGLVERADNPLTLDARHVAQRVP